MQCHIEVFLLKPFQTLCSVLETNTPDEELPEKPTEGSGRWHCLPQLLRQSRNSTEIAFKRCWYYYYQKNYVCYAKYLGHRSNAGRFFTDLVRGLLCS